MEMKATSVFAVMLLFLLAVPCLSTGRLHVERMDSEVYVIDYRGPETHTYFPPPGRNKGKPRFHQKTGKAHHGSKVKKIHLR